MQHWLFLESSSALIDWSTEKLAKSGGRNSFPVCDCKCALVESNRNLLITELDSEPISPDSEACSSSTIKVFIITQLKPLPL